jgi:uncharacterized protein (TIGR02996 family)
MHPEADAFLDAIFDHPDDDTPRLVYADWLQEHGQENYAQFIRLQCAAAREKPWSDEANRLWEEIGRVWNRLDDEWWPATREEWSVDDSRSELLDAVHFNRGFLRPVVRVASNHLVACEACWAWLPTPATTLELWPESDLESLASVPVLRRVSHIQSRSDWWDYDEDSNSVRSSPGLDALLRSPHLSRLRELDLKRCWLTPANVQTLLEAPGLSAVESLRVSLHPLLWDVALPDAIPDRKEAARKLRGRFKHVQVFLSE